jgi:Fe-S-cluster containining protein
MVEPHKIKEMADIYADRNMKFRSFLKNRADPDKLDLQFRDLHNEIFIRDEYDCCKCCNCCKLYDIRIEPTDIPAISTYLGLSEDEFAEQYLTPDDEDADVSILKDKPCCFLEADGKCRIYEVRPLVCREFPHTNKPDRLFSMISMIDFAEDCPVIFEILERLKVIYRFRN